MTPNGEFTNVSVKWEEYMDTEDECFLNILQSFLLREEQEEDSWFSTCKSLITSCVCISTSSALDDRWFDEVLDVCCQSYSFLISCLVKVDAGNFVSSFYK